MSAEDNTVPRNTVPMTMAKNRMLSRDRLSRAMLLNCAILSRIENVSLFEASSGIGDLSLEECPQAELV